MKKDLVIAKLNQQYPMIGLSADWIYRTWLISGDMTKGKVIFENEDNDTYELLSFYYDNDEVIIVNLLYSGFLKDVVDRCLMEDN